MDIIIIINQIKCFLTLHDWEYNRITPELINSFDGNPIKTPEGMKVDLRKCKHCIAQQKFIGPKMPLFGNHPIWMWVNF